MEQKLRKHDDSRGDSWKDESPEWHLARLKKEVAELEKAVASEHGYDQEAADVANFAMFVSETSSLRRMEKRRRGASA